MADVQVLLSNAPGPLPIKLDYQNEDDDPLVFFVAGSAFSTAGSARIGIQLFIDGKLIDTVTVFANEPSSHKALVAKMISVPALSIGKHTISLSAAAGTTTDANDVVSLAIFPEAAFVLNQDGPIPAYTSFQSQVSGPALVFLSGSAYTQYGGTCGIYLVMDGNPVLTSSVYMNEVNSHHAVPAVFGTVDLTPGPHKIGFSTTTGDMMTDQNDFFSAAVFF
jgi:hypothetical protein